MSSDAICFLVLVLVLPAQNWVFEIFFVDLQPLRKAAFREWFDLGFSCVGLVEGNSVRMILLMVRFMKLSCTFRF